MKRPNKILIAAALAAIVLALCSCGGAEVSSVSGTAAADVSGRTVEETAGIMLVSDGVSEWRVVRPEVCDEKVLQAARSIDVHLYNRFGAHAENKNDLADPVGKEILVGLTNRPESQEVYSSLAENSYAIKEVNGKIVIIGANDKATAKAVEVFLLDWVDRAAKPSEGEKANVPVSLGEGKNGYAP